MTSSAYHPAAPPLQVAQWFNTREPLSLESLRGRVVLLHAFQMLCPGCVEHGIPQARRVHEAFSPDQVTVIGLQIGVLVAVLAHVKLQDPPGRRVERAAARRKVLDGLERAFELAHPLAARVQVRAHHKQEDR